MKKKIAVYIGEIGGAFQHTLMQVITAKANDYMALSICDEFAAVLNTDIPNRQAEFKKEFEEAISVQGREISDYQLGASVGVCELAEDPGATLIACLQKADMRMYEDKKTKKNHR